MSIVAIVLAVMALGIYLTFRFFKVIVALGFMVLFGFIGTIVYFLYLV